MKALKVAHTSDWHWCSEKLDRVAASAKEVIERLRIEKPDLHVISGDWWDRRQSLSRASAVIPAIEALKALADISPLVMILGNFEHDPQGSHQIFDDLHTRFPIYTTERAETVFLMHVGENDRVFASASDAKQFPDDVLAILHLFPYPTKSHLIGRLTEENSNLSIDQANSAILDLIDQIFLGMGVIGHEWAGTPTVFVGHLNVAGSVMSNGQTSVGQDIIIPAQSIEKAGAQYYALGHIHKAQQIGGLPMFYAGSVYHCDFGEIEKKSFNIVELGPNGARSVQTIQLPSRPMSTHDVEFDAAMKYRLSSPTHHEWDWENAFLRVRVHLTKEQHGLVSDDDVRATFPGAFDYQIERITIPEERVRHEAVVKKRTLHEKLVEWGLAMNKEIPPLAVEYAKQTESAVQQQ